MTVLVTDVVYLKALDVINLWSAEIFRPHTRLGPKMNFVFGVIDGVSRPHGSKNYFETKENGNWPDLALQREIASKPHVFLFISSTLRFEKMEKTTRDGAADMLKATLPCLLSFWGVKLQKWFLHLQNSCLWSQHAVARGRRRHMAYYARSGEHFMEIFKLFTQLLTDSPQVTPLAYKPQCPFSQLGVYVAE